MKKFPRSSGVLLHPTALPGPWGIGSLGKPTLNFLQWLEEAGQSYWQICPMGPTGYGDSPYQCFSAFAGNPNLIDLEELCRLNLLETEDLDPMTEFPSHKVDFGHLIPAKNKILMKAYKHFTQGHGPACLGEQIQKFREESTYWLDDYCLFMALKLHNGGKSWDQWDKVFKDKNAISLTDGPWKETLEAQAFIQFIFDKQWKNVKKQATKRNIKIIGDLPIFIAFDSADCWARPELFQLDKDLKPMGVAGVPPDYFSPTGQLWGNPLYNWETMEDNKFAWWIAVLKDKIKRYDVLRIDHFRGFAAYWSIPYGDDTAVNGTWVTAPGQALFRRVRDEMGDIPIIAEDLGVITPDVTALIEEFGFPGMKVLQFAFDSLEENDYLPHKFSQHCLVYSGTHDNDTSAGWFDSVRDEDKKAAIDYLNLGDNADGPKLAKALVRAAMASVADLAISPFQDLLGLDSQARFNTPGTSKGNWIWRATENMLNAKVAADTRELTRIYGRLH